MTHSWFERGMTLTLAGLALLAFVGCDQVFGLYEVEPNQEHSNAYLCECTCFAGEPAQVTRSFATCAPPALNPNLNGGVAVTLEQLASDCDGRVRDTFVGILTQCGSNNVRRRLQDDPSLCTCQRTFGPTFVNACNGPCQSIPLTDCSVADTATSVGGLEPVCIAEDSPSGQQSMGRVLYDDRSTCVVAGHLSVSRGGDDPETDPVSGVVEVAGQPCPGASCSVDLFYRLSDHGSLSFDSYAGLASVTFRDIVISGRTSSPVALDGSGGGLAGELGLSSSGRGTREEELVFGAISSTETRSYLGTNVEPVDVTVDWQARRCSIVGALLDAEIEGEATDVIVDVLGTIVGQPPRANAGPDRSVECTSPSGALVELRAGDSSDPDHDIAFRDWWLGIPGPSPIDDPNGDGDVVVAQALGTSVLYTLSVVDTRAAISRDAVTIAVVDTTAPTITALSASPDVLRPRNHMMVPVAVSATASDACGDTACHVSAVGSSQPTNAVGDGNTQPDWRITGPLSVEVRAETAGGVDRIYTIETTCADDSGNEARATTEVRVTARR